MPKQCTTCHFACACREERFKALIYAAMSHHHMPEEWRKEAVDLLYGGRATQPEPESHVCTFHRAMDGTCFVCGSVDEEIRASLNPPESSPSSDEANQSPRQCLE
jgi:hypothetical protein